MVGLVKRSQVEQVIECLNDINASDQVIEKFKKEKIDLDALALLTDSELEEFGILAKGDRLKLKALASKHDQQKDIKHQNNERLKELKHIIKNSKQRNGQQDKNNVVSRKRKGPIAVQFGWKHWSEEKESYVQRRVAGGGGTRKVQVERDATSLDFKNIAINLFLPDNSSSLEFDKEKFLLSLGNFRGEKICSWKDFSLEKYKSGTGMCPPRLYLLSKEIALDEDDCLEKSVFTNDCDFDLEDVEPHAATSVEQADQPPVKQSKTESKVKDVPESKLLGTSLERQFLKNEQDEAYMQSLLADQAKNKQVANLEENKTNHEVTAMEKSLKEARTKRVPPEPIEGDKIQIAIRHPMLGLKTRYFSPQNTMVAVYDWCGSLSLQPAYFSLSLKPDLVLQPYEDIQNYSQVILHVRPEDQPISLEPSSPTVTLNGYGPLSNISNDETLETLDVFSELPDIIMIEDDKESTSTGDIAAVNENMDSSSNIYNPPRTVFIRRTLILQDMKRAFSWGIPTGPINICFIDGTGKPELGVDNGGLLRDALTGFWSAFFESCTVGEEARVPQLRHDFQKSKWRAVGVILYLGIKCLNYFPTKLAQSFFITFLFGESALNDDDLINCFLNFVANDEQIIIKKALDIFSEVPNDDIVDLLERFNCRRLPCAGNFRELIREIAHREIVQAAQYVIECWSDLRAHFLRLHSVASVEAVSTLYESLIPSNKKVLEMLKPTDYLSAIERETLMYLQRFIRGLSQEMLENFLRFATGSNVICVEQITIDFIQLDGAGRRPMAHICSALLQVPTNYTNYSDFRGEWSNIIRQGDWSMDFL